MKPCFVCGTKTFPEKLKTNVEVNLPVCEKCSGSEQEKEKVKELLDSLAEDFVCGCI